jgi:hypothetical protein
VAASPSAATNAANTTRDFMKYPSRRLPGPL